MFHIRFKAKRDGYFQGIMLAIIGMITIGWGFSIWSNYKNEDYTGFIISIVVYMLIMGTLLWIMYGISYEFYDDYLFVRGGPFRSKITYKDMIKITSTRQIFIGYRILSARDAIEVHYKTGLFGSVKITPQDQDLFLEELKKRSPLIKLDEI